VTEIWESGVGVTLIFSSWAWNSQKTVGFDAAFFGDKFYKLRYIDLCVVQETVFAHIDQRS
jgi:hypothetical protein